MKNHEQIWGRRTDKTRFLPGLGVFAGGFVYGELPHGAFGAHDVAVRVAITGAAVFVAGLLIWALSKWWRHATG